MAGADGVVMASQVGLVIDGRAEDVAEEAVDTDAVLLHRTSEVEALRERIRELALHLTHMRSATEYQASRFLLDFCCLMHLLCCCACAPACTATVLLGLSQLPRCDEWAY